LTAKELIYNQLPTLKTSDTGADALQLMNELKVSHLPIVNNKNFLGVISEKDIFEFNNFKEAIGDHPLSLNRAFVNEWQHLFEVIKTVDENKLTLIPVLDKHGNYSGSIITSELVFALSRLLQLDKPGALLLLEMSINDYSLTEIANIIESNNAKILAAAVINKPESSRIDLVIKINTIEINSIQKTFERYGYELKAVYEKQYDDDGLKERYDMLMKYLDV